jgi:hypothetical protein
MLGAFCARHRVECRARRGRSVGRVPRPATRYCASLVLLTLGGGHCAKPSSEIRPVPSEADGGSGRAPSTRDASVEAPAPAWSEADWQAHLDGFFAAFAGANRDVSFLEAALADELPRYITLRNTTRSAVVEDARRFFARKSDIRYARLGARFAVRDEAPYTVVETDLSMQWDRPAPSEVSARSREASPAVHRDVSVAVQIWFDADHRIRQYVETLSPPSRLCVTVGVDPRTGERDESELELPEGTCVVDLHETAPGHGDSERWTTLRHVRYAGADRWLVEQVEYVQPITGVRFSYPLLTPALR